MADSGNTGELIVLALKDAGTSHLFTLNGAHIWPMLTGAVEHGIRILGPVNLASSMAFQASQLYARNVLNFLMSLYDKKSGTIHLDAGDEVVKACMVTRRGEVVQPV